MNAAKVIGWLVIGLFCLLAIWALDLALGLVSGIMGLIISLAAGLLGLAFSKVGLTFLVIGLVIYALTKRSRERHHYDF